MNVLFYADEPDPQPWVEALRRALPEAAIHHWIAGAVPRCDYAVCWKPPAAFFAGQSALKAILNIGAGADAVISDPNLPAGVPVTVFCKSGSRSTIAASLLDRAGVEVRVVTVGGAARWPEPLEKLAP